VDGATRLRPATAGDIDFILDQEARPGLDRFISPWSRERHEAALAEPSKAYLVLEDGDAAGGPLGYAILSDLDSPDRSIALWRIVVAEPGRGIGKRFLRGVMAWAFEEKRAHRLWLDVAEDNPRAEAVYRALGFVEEGRMRESFLRPDGYATLILMSILEREYRRL